MNMKGTLKVKKKQAKGKQKSQRIGAHVGYTLLKIYCIISI
jgi:hypothetical protein